MTSECYDVVMTNLLMAQHAVANGKTDEAQFHLKVAKDALQKYWTKASTQTLLRRKRK